jgi:hypothetical protein
VSEEAEVRKRQKARYLRVERCGVGHCPQCIPDAYNMSYNWCHNFNNPQKISSKLKGFPVICPLDR